MDIKILRASSTITRCSDAKEVTVTRQMPVGVVSNVGDSYIIKYMGTSFNALSSQFES